MNIHEKNGHGSNYKMLAQHIEMFKSAFASYIEQYKSLKKPAKTETEEALKKTGQPLACEKGSTDGVLFDELLSNYYRTVISALKKLAGFDKKYIPELVETYTELWKSAPKNKEKDYISPYLLDLCKFLYETKESESLAFFYNLLIYCREIPFLPINDEQEKLLAESYAQNGEEDPFAGFRNERKERTAAGFDEGLFDRAYEKFFLILSGWDEKTEGYYSKDEICFMNGLFILDEIADYAYKFYTTANYFNGGSANKIEIEIDNKSGGMDADASAVNKNKIEYTKRDEEINRKISFLYEKALRYFNRSIRYNPNNPRYYYEYARCLKNSGKSDEAEVFFKKAFELNG